ncbi:hypothetical protein ACWOFR_13925 [Carnobacterium gallinarum]|uniref:hypothetical protein n=1 Tax=Carnobacterium gallinarum TaxID=2749 RepID=UPI000556ED25|nr:hypothetical protein [Carnobacterium gallinarum]
MIWYSTLGLLFFIFSCLLVVSFFLQILFRMELRNLKRRKPQKEKNILKWEERMIPLIKKVKLINYIFIVSVSSVVVLFFVLSLYTAILQRTNQLSLESITNQLKAEYIWE